MVVLDGVGIGAAHDAADYGDADSNTLGHVAAAVEGFALPALGRMGLGTLAPLPGLRDDAGGTAARGTLQPASAGKDSTSGHWELCGVHLDVPFPTYPDGFPDAIIGEFARLTGRDVIGNIAASGTAVLEQYGEAHERTGAWIVYTSADSVFQIAAHEGQVPLEELYAACAVARGLLVPPHNVSRVIARPFEGDASTGYRRTPHRRDFSIEPPGETLLDALGTADIPRAGVGKVDDLFARRSISATHTSGNAEGIDRIRAWLAGSAGGLLFANLVDFDQLFGHRNDTGGFYRALREFDDALPGLLSLLREDDLLVITADHGNDPTTPSTDHARERVPLLVAGPRVRPVALGERSTFSDVGATLGEWFGLGFRGRGRSFLTELLA